MKLRLLMIGATVALVVGLLISFAGLARAQVVQSEKLRFRMIGDEPIASPDGRSVVSGLKVVVLRDTRSDQCYVAFISGSAMSTTGPSVCP